MVPLCIVSTTSIQGSFATKATLRHPDLHSQTTKIMNLLSLPREIRNQIYELLLFSSQPVSFDPFRGFQFAKDDTPKGLELMDSSYTPYCVVKEARETFYRANIFEVKCRDLGQFLDFTTFQLGRNPASASSQNCVRHLVLTERCGTFDDFHRLRNCPKLCKVELSVFELTGLLGTFSLSIIEITKVCVELAARLHVSVEVSISFLDYHSYTSHRVKVDMSWIFYPDKVLANRVDGSEAVELSLKQLIPLQLATMSAFKDQYSDMDASQVKIIQRILLTVVARELEAKAKEEDHQRRPHTASQGQSDWTDTFCSRAWQVASRAGRNLEAWLQKHAMVDGQDQLKPLLPNYPAIVAETHSWN